MNLILSKSQAWGRQRDRWTDGGVQNYCLNTSMLASIQAMRQAPKWCAYTMTLLAWFML